ncbi:MAG: wax ester/triacylglycerol synthase family O-acyltransferase [Bacteroidota bacterium]
MAKIKLPKLENTDLEPISGMDATFLYMERHNSPMHVGSVIVIEGSLDFEEFKQTILSRLHQMPKLRKKLVYVPLSVDYPYWADDPDFDIDMHLSHIALPNPGGWKELRRVASDVFSEPLSQNRPLWSFTFVEHLDTVSQVPKGSVAIISKMHHVMIDGQAGAGLMSIIFDMSPNTKPIPAPRPYKPKPLPNELSLITTSAMSFAKNPFKFPKLIRDTVTATVKAGFLSRATNAELPTAPFTAPPTQLNGIVSPRKKWNGVILSLPRVKKLYKIMGTTLNDVMLAICAGALRRYFLEKGALPAKPLVAMVPISTRTKAEANQQGNQVSNMLVQLATDIADPIERLEEIHENTVRGKTYQKAIGAKTLSKLAEAVPFGIANQAARLYSRFQMAELHNPVFNVTITNVPGVQFPLYFRDHKVHSIMGMAPIIDGMGLIITILSYNGTITISPTSDVKSMPEQGTFSRYLLDSANELETAVLAYEKSGKKKKPAAKPKAKSDALFAHMKKYFKENPKAVKPDSGIFQFVVKAGELETLWKLDLNKSPAVVTKTKAAKPDATFTIKDDHLLRIGQGKLNIQTAFIQGRLKIHGDSAKAMKLGGILMKLPKMGV